MSLRWQGRLLLNSRSNYPIYRRIPSTTNPGHHQLQRYNRSNQLRQISFQPGNPNPFASDDQDDPNASGKWKELGGKVLEAMFTTFASLFVLGCAGYSYHKYYKHLVLDKIENAFQAGDPVLRLHKDDDHERQVEPSWIHRSEQDLINDIVHGNESGHYYLIIGEKGTGKSSMLIESMYLNDGARTAMIESHSDMEIFRVRVGKALDYEFAEDFIGGLFSIKGQRDATAILDIERALNKLEKVLIDHKHSKKDPKPLVLIINNMHLFRDNDESNALLELLQHRAETWSRTGMMNVIFCSDEYWVYERLKRNAVRMKLITIRDLKRKDAMDALRYYRKAFFKENVSDETLNTMYDLIGGRLSFISKCAKARDMVKAAKQINQEEKQWLLNKAVLIPDFDDDVLEEGKWSVAVYRLVKALVEKGEQEDDEANPDEMPYIMLHDARKMLTRVDFMQPMDACNIITIDTESRVFADSRAMMNAFKEIAREENFEEDLEGAADRCDEVEALQRTRELTVKKREDSFGKDRQSDTSSSGLKIWGR